MLTELKIENILLMEKIDILFDDGFSVITGQTGAGKSILIDSLNIILGDRAGNAILRDKDKNGTIMASFEFKNNTNPDVLRVKHILYENGFFASKDENTIIIKKIITKNGSKIFINDIQTTIQFVNNITRNLLEIYSQFEQTDLFAIKKHLEIVDNFGCLNNEVLKVKQLYQIFQSAKEKYLKTQLEIEQQKQNIEYLTDFIKDVEALNLQFGEYEDLLKTKKEMTDIETTSTYVLNALNEIDGVKFGVAINKAQNNLERAKHSIECHTNTTLNDEENTERQNPLLNHFVNAIELLEKVYNDYQLASEVLNDINSKYTFDENKLNEVENRISAINEVARKYKTTPEELPNQLILAKEKLSKIELADDVLQKLNNDLLNKQNEYIEASKRLSQLRKNASLQLEQNVLQKLANLKMEKVRFYTSFEEIEPTEQGIDKVVFFASMNNGINPAPIHKIASGGELSRFMLAFKSALCDSQQIETIIFDEIDTGVSGSVAYAIGKELKSLSLKTQVICITHNPQTACCANNHFLVSKEHSLNDTRTIVKKLSQEERVLAVAEMMSTDEITDEAMQNARKMLGF